MHHLKVQAKKILRSTERYTRTDMLYLARSGFWSLFSQGIGSLSSFLVVLLLANILPKEIFGEYRFILSLLPLLVVFTLPGVATTLMRSVARGNIVNLPEIARTKMRWSLMGSIAALIAAGYYWYNGNAVLAGALLMAAASLPFVETFFIYASYYKGKQDFKTAAIYESISRVFQASVIILAALISRNILVLVGAFFLGQIIARFFFYRKTVSNIESQSEIDAAAQESADDTIEYGKHLSLVTVMNTVTNNMDKLLVGHFLGPTMLAVYYIALTIPKNIVLFFNVIPRVAFPKFSQKIWDSREYARILRKLSLMGLGLLIPAGIYALLVPSVLPVLFHMYGASVSAAVILAALIVVSPLNAMTMQILQARKFVKKIVLVQSISVIVFTILFLLTHAVSGASGAALSLVASELTVLGVSLIFIR